MPLSIHKLQDLFNAKGFIASKYFVHNDLCFYIELFSIKTADIFFLYIPTKYEIEVQLKDTTVGTFSWGGFSPSPISGPTTLSGTVTSPSLSPSASASPSAPPDEDED